MCLGRNPVTVRRTRRSRDWLIKINELIARLTADVPADHLERNAEQQARWILANILDWHRREEKAVWWEYFRLSDISAEELLEERAGLSGLIFVDAVGRHRKGADPSLSFPAQETEIRGGEKLRSLGGAELGTVDAISFADNTVDIKKRKDTAGVHPQAVFAHSHVGGQVMADALVRIGEYVADHGLVGDGPYQAARDLLLKREAARSVVSRCIAKERPPSRPQFGYAHIWRAASSRFRDRQARARPSPARA